MFPLFSGFFYLNSFENLLNQSGYRTAYSTYVDIIIGFLSSAYNLLFCKNSCRWNICLKHQPPNNHVSRPILMAQQLAMRVRERCFPILILWEYFQTPINTICTQRPFAALWSFGQILFFITQECFFHIKICYSVYRSYGLEGYNFYLQTL